MTFVDSFEFDIFISHASEDKDRFVPPDALRVVVAATNAVPLSGVASSDETAVSYGDCIGCALGAPVPRPAFYMSQTTTVGLNALACTSGQRFAQENTNGRRLLMLDFGGIRKDGSSFGARAPFTTTVFSNAQILVALKKAADCVHNNYTGTGVAEIAGLLDAEIICFGC